MTSDPGYTPSPSYAAVQRFMVIPASYVFLRRGDEVLLQLRSGTGYMDDHWAAGAAGHVEEGEDAYGAAVREAAEELGVTLTVEDLVPLAVMHRTQRDGRQVNERVDFFFSATQWQGEPCLMESAKSADLRWVPLDTLGDLPVVPHEHELLSRWRDGTLRPIITHGF